MKITTNKDVRALDVQMEPSNLLAETLKQVIALLEPLVDNEERLRILRSTAAYFGIKIYR